MQRTTLMLPMDLKRRAQRLAVRRGLSLGALVRESLEAALRGDDGEVREDSIYSDSAVYDGPAPRTLASDHDKFLYDASGEVDEVEEPES